MADRTFQEVNLTLFKRVVNLYPAVMVTGTTPVLQKRVFNAAGAGGVAPRQTIVAAPTTGVGYAAGDGDGGCRSVVRTGAGVWVFTFSDSYQSILQVSLTVLNATGLFTTPVPVITAASLGAAQSTLNSRTSLGIGGTVTLTLNNGSGVATDPASGDMLLFNFTLADSSVP